MFLFVCLYLTEEVMSDDKKKKEAAKIKAAKDKAKGVKMVSPGVTS